MARPLRSKTKRRALVRILQSHNEREETNIARILFVKIVPNWFADLGGLIVLIARQAQDGTLSSGCRSSISGAQEPLLVTAAKAVYSHLGNLRPCSISTG